MDELQGLLSLQGEIKDSKNVRKTREQLPNLLTKGKHFIRVTDFTEGLK